MGKTNQTIEINGKKYDASTGQRIISHQSEVATHKPVKKPVSSSTIKTTEDVRRTSASHSGQVHKKHQRSQTLHRVGLKKPQQPKPISSTSLPHKVKPQQPKSSHSSPLTKHLDIARVKRAGQVKRSNLVSKFGSVGAQTQHPIEQPLETRQVVNMEVRPAPVLLQKAPVSPVQAVLENGLKNAQSHKQAPHSVKKSKRAKKSGRSKVLSYASGALAVFLLGGFIAYQNVPNISMRYASARSGISASLPGYQPSGFSLNRNIEYNPGQITLEFSSNSDERQFSITQKETSWNSESLFSNYVVAKGGQNQKYEDKGRTIYLYGNNNATWVNGGIWYDLNGDSQLNSDQLIRIATSM